MKYLGPPQSGSQANTTASHNRAGQYLRNRRKPVTPTRTPKQGILRGKFASASAAWQTLSQSLQSSWTAFAANYPVVDALGQTVVLTGQQYYIGLQTSLLNAGQAMQTAVPTNTNIPAIDTPTVYADSTGTLIVSVASVTAGDWNLAALSKPLSNGKNFNKNFSQFAVLNSISIIADVSVAYAAQYGAPVAGKKIFGRFREVNSNGMSSAYLILQTPVGADPTLAAPVATSPLTGSVTLTQLSVSDANWAVFDATTGLALAIQYSQSSPATLSSLVAGTTVYGRYQKLTGEWSAPSNSIMVT